MEFFLKAFLWNTNLGDLTEFSKKEQIEIQPRFELCQNKKATLAFSRIENGQKRKGNRKITLQGINISHRKGSSENHHLQNAIFDGICFFSLKGKCFDIITDAFFCHVKSPSNLRHIGLDTPPIFKAETGQQQNEGWIG